ncbi:MAG: hypothetical protein LC790_05905, partial [Actinobacteria bacterium]|nr:hypothetical protein [Actinomycetota bacterium]
HRERLALQPLAGGREERVDVHNHFDGKRLLLSLRRSCRARYWCSFIPALAERYRLCLTRAVQRSESRTCSTRSRVLSLDAA